MTVIVTDGKVMAGDGLTVGGWTICSTTARKVILLNDGRVMGCSGHAVTKAKLLAWFNGGEQGEKPSLDEKSRALLIDGTDVIREYDSSLNYIVLPAPQAIGCGSDIAFGALDMGADPIRAVEVACARSIGCGGEITALHVNSPMSSA